MKIAISAHGVEVESLSDVRFGRCRYFQIHDTEGGEIKILENKGQFSGGGAGIAAAQQVLDENVDAIITGSLGPNAFKIINKSGIKVYKCESIAVSSILGKFEKDELKELTQSGPAHHGI
ncbi:NifB/NifX family molybdenum-iron cluster-binding protein [Clostridium kluyveri]|uniref:NifB/NifX family molybdenum-iron cluster-binding protein n=1 Tax=Clostridium kluyveri TaxID=1534 RepID=UPI002245225B|nr:NifB/NifX family molybdenum-iron cluster-binding protein [Clostridium kluyveri]UZQ51982.1 diguanylate cyclase [Clostridium kluyveri]